MFFKSDKNNNIHDDLSKVAALLIHAAKIDQDYSKKEETIIKQTLIEIGANNENINVILQKGKEIEKNSNQILDFTKEIKNADETFKIKIIESLWKIIYSNKEADMFESNLMRRLSGLLYLDNKVVGEIKEKIKKDLVK